MNGEDKIKKQDGRKTLGALGEQLAADLLERSGCRLLTRNWRCRKGEIDLVVEDGDNLVFVEVRTRRETGTFGTPQESVNARKQNQVRELARMYMHTTKSYDRKCRFDVVAVRMDPQGQLIGIDHIRGAF